MPPRIITVLDRLRQDIAASLTPQAIEQACQKAQYSWRKRVLDPATTIYLFLLQVPHGNTAGQHVVPFGGWTFTDSAYCQARKRLPLAVFHWLLEQTAAAFRTATSSGARWLGHRVWIVDGSSFSMPDEPELQRHFGQPGCQRPGCGFPVAKWRALFDLSTGMLLRSAAAPLRTHDMAQSPTISRELGPGDLVLGDRGLCSQAHLALLTQRGTLARVLHDRGDPDRVTVGEIMAQPLPQLDVGVPLDEAYRLLLGGNTGVLATSGGAVVDIVTRIDLIHYWNQMREGGDGSGR